MTLSYHRNPTPTEVLSGAIKCEKEKSGETEKSRSKACLISPSIRVVIALEDITRVTERPCARSIVHGPVCTVTTHRYHCMFDRLSDTLWPLLSSRSVGRSMHIMIQLLNDWSCGIYLIAAYSQMLWPYDLSYSFLTAIFFFRMLLAQSGLCTVFAVLAGSALVLRLPVERALWAGQTDRRLIYRVRERSVLVQGFLEALLNIAICSMDVLPLNERWNIGHCFLGSMRRICCGYINCAVTIAAKETAQKGCVLARECPFYPPFVTTIKWKSLNC